MGIFDFLSPPAANIPPPQFNAYQPQGLASSEGSLLGGIGSLGNYNLTQGFLPQAGGLVSQVLGTDYGGQAQNAANNAGAMGQQAGQNAFGYGTSLAGYAPNLFAGGNAVFNTAFDPQQALYNRTLQQTQDQTRAGLEARGLDMTPYGAGVEGQNLNNFNIDWQNNQLGRQLQGLQGLGSAYGQGANLYGQGAGLQAQGASAFNQFGQLPYQTFVNQRQGDLGMINSLGGLGQQASQIPQQQNQDWQNYLGWGLNAQNAYNQAQQNQFSDALNQDKQAFGEQQSTWQGLGNLAGGLWGTNLGGGTLGAGVLNGIGGLFGGGAAGAGAMGASSLGGAAALAPFALV